jgi:hypothetical protein
MIELKISDLIPDDKNYNKGTEFGNSLIEKSLRKFGAGRSILLDKNNRIIAGNKTIENATAIGLEDIIIIETTGNQIVAVKRLDIDLDSKMGRELAFADNASAKANIDWDMDNVYEDWTKQEALNWGVSESKEDMQTVEEAQEENFIKISIETTNNAFIEMNEKLQNLCDEYSAIMKVK